MKINSQLGFRPVPFSELTDDDEFWRGCKGCKNYDILERNNRKMCLCTGLLYDPAEHKGNEKPVKTDDSTLLKYLKKGLQPIAKVAHLAKLW